VNNCSAVGLHLCQSGKEGPRNTRLCNLVAPSKELPKKGFEGEAERHLTGKETESWELIYFKLYKSQLPLVKKALETAGLMLGTDKSWGLLPGDDQRGYEFGPADGRSEHPSPTANTSVRLTFRVNGYRRNPMSVAAP
jgi:hypothetical protein